MSARQVVVDAINAHNRPVPPDGSAEAAIAEIAQAIVDALTEAGHLTPDTTP